MYGHYGVLLSLAGLLYTVAQVLHFQQLYLNYFVWARSTIP